ncbi:TetR/AcrR family transcriptional regulator [Kribbella sp. NPDC055110]
MLGTPKRDRQAERREATRREILDAAWGIARERGLNEVTLRAVADRIGMRAPSLYTHFDSKMAMYDAMFGQAWADYEQLLIASERRLPADPRAKVLRCVRLFFDFQVADLARYQLMNQSVILGFEPTSESFAVSERVVARVIEILGGTGVRDRDAIEILFAVVGGLISQQHANDPGGRSRRPLLSRAVEMWADGVGLPAHGA